MQIDKAYIDKTKSIILHTEPNDFQVFKKMLENCIYLGEISKTSRGLPYQRYVTKERSGHPILRGINISRYFHSNGDEYLGKEKIDEDDDKVAFLRQSKIISQRIVAHVTTPRDHIIIMSTIDRDGILTVDTVENTIITDNNYSLEFVLCLLNSKLISWYGYRYIFANAIRTMDLDDYYVGKVPIPRGEIDQEIFISLADTMLSLNKQLHTINTDFSHYINLHPRLKDVKLEDYLKQIPEKDKEVLKDGSGTPANKLEGKVKKFEIREDGEWLIFKVGYSKKTQKGTEIIIEFDAFKIRLSDKNFRKFIYYSIREFITPGKVGKGNIIERIFKIKYPCFNSNEKENRRIIDKIMEPFLKEVAKSEEIEKEIAETDKTIDQKVYELFSLTEEEIKIVEESLKR